MLDVPFTQALVVLCTCPSQEVAEALAGELVEARHAACINIVPEITSVYRWQGAVQQDSEALLIIKTTRDAFPALQEALKQGHPYELPEVIAVPVANGSPEYLAWLNASSR